MFTQKISMKCSSDQFRTFLEKELVRIGYEVEEYMDRETYPYITNNLNEREGWIGSAIEGRQLQVGRNYLGEFNAPLFLALAAMTDKEYGGYGEYWVLIAPRLGFTEGKLYKADKPVNVEYAFIADNGTKNGFSVAPFKNIRKATREEIGQYFMNLKEKTVMKEETFKVKRKEMENIYKVACSDWKAKIADMIVRYQESPFSDKIFLPEKVVGLMFESANEEQLPTLKGVFPEFSKDKNPFLKSFDPHHLDTVSRELFGDTTTLEIGFGGAISIGRSDLKGRSLYIDRSCEVKFHKTPQGGTLIEINKK